MLSHFEKAFEPKALNHPDAFYAEQGAKRALQLFHDAAERVPAYKDFLKKAKIDHQHVRTIADFASIHYGCKKLYCGVSDCRALLGWQTSCGTAYCDELRNNRRARSSGRGPQNRILRRQRFMIGSIEITSGLISIPHCSLSDFPWASISRVWQPSCRAWHAAAQNRKLTIMSVGNNKAEMLPRRAQSFRPLRTNCARRPPFFYKRRDRNRRSGGDCVGA